MTREGLPNKRENETHEIVHFQQNGDKLELTITLAVFSPESQRAGQVAEVFIDLPSYAQRKTMNAMVAKDAGTLISVAIQSGADLSDLADAMGHSETVLPMHGAVDLPHTIMGTVLRYLAGLKPDEQPQDQPS